MTRHLAPNRWSSSLLLSLALFLAAGACGPGDGTGERIEGARETAGQEPAEGSLAASATGTFQLSLAGDLDEELQGEAVCTVGPAASELRVVMRAAEAPDRMTVLQIPEYDGTGSYQATVQVSGTRRATGPAEAAVSSVSGEAGVLEDQVAVAFRGTYAGTAGTGEIEGEARCTPGEAEQAGG